MTLNLVEAAALLRIHKNTLQGRARAGVIPGAKTPSGLTPQTVRPPGRLPRAGYLRRAPLQPRWNLTSIFDLNMKPRLTQERATELLMYDPLTGLLTWKVRVGSRGLAGHVAGGLDARGYIYLGVEGRGYFAHRVAWLIHYGRWPAAQIDHIDGDKTNNRLANLRDVTGAVNIQNQHAPRAHNKLGVRGVSRNSKGFQSEILTNGVRQYLGTFDTLEEAQLAYLGAKRELHACGVR